MTMIRNHVVVTDGGVGGTGRYRGAQVWSITANNLTFQARVESNISGWLACPRSFAPGMIVGDPAALEVAGDGAASYAIVSVHETTFAGPSGSNDSVAVGAFHYGRIPDHLSGVKPFRPWWSGMLNERSADYWRW